MNTASAMITIGATISTRISRGRTTSEPFGRKRPVNGSGKPPPALILGRLKRRKSNSWATPTVAISNTSRGLSKSRRTTVNSMVMPMSDVATTANANASQYGTPYCTWNSANRATPNAPISPWAKFKMPVHR